ncbi:MAG: hypothetical protein CSB46_01680, partial [Micrococcales bacterium]
HHTFHRGAYRVVWDSHAEFVSYSGFATGSQEDRGPFDPEADHLFPAEWLSAWPTRRIAAVQVEVLAMPDDPIRQLRRWLDPTRTVASTVLGASVVIASDFVMTANGWTRFVVFADPATGPGRLGRVVQRLLDIETYRAMAMLGYPRAQQLNRTLAQLEPRIVELVAELGDEARPAEEALHDLLSVTEDLEALSMHHDFRAGATLAYDAIVVDRLRALNENRYAGRQLIRDFLNRRYRPAIRTVESTQSRLLRRLEQVDRAGDLLRTRVDVARQAQNQRVLESMDRNAAGIEKEWLMAVLTPLVLLGAWLGMRWLRSRIHRHE